MLFSTWKHKFLANLYSCSPTHQIWIVSSQLVPSEVSQCSSKTCPSLSLEPVKVILYEKMDLYTCDFLRTLRWGNHLGICMLVQPDHWYSYRRDAMGRWKQKLDLWNSLEAVRQGINSLLEPQEGPGVINSFILACVTV